MLTWRRDQRQLASQLDRVLLDALEPAGDRPHAQLLSRQENPDDASEATAAIVGTTSDERPMR